MNILDDSWMQFYYEEWQKARNKGNIEYSKSMKEEYRIRVMLSLEKTYKQYITELKMYPPIYLN